jgi:hypothetical protein
LAEERGSVTILFGGLTWKHERLIEGLLAGAGYLCQRLPETDRAAHEIAQEHCASGLCNPVYFTVGNLLRYLRRLQGSGLSAAHIVKIWAAKFVARHPNLISVELSNFKCGHDAFISRLIERIIAASGKPHFSFRDLDENRPLASIRIRVETMHYFLKHYREQLKGKVPIAQRRPAADQRELTAMPDSRDFEIPPERPTAVTDASSSTRQEGVQL